MQAPYLNRDAHPLDGLGELANEVLQLLWGHVVKAVPKKPRQGSWGRARMSGIRK